MAGNCAAAGRWTEEEHEAFLSALKLVNGKPRSVTDWKTMASGIKTRTAVQVRTHAQKYFEKIKRRRERTGGCGNHQPCQLSDADTTGGSTPKRARCEVQSSPVQSSSNGLPQTPEYKRPRRIRRVTPDFNRAVAHVGGLESRVSTLVPVLAARSLGFEGRHKLPSAVESTKLSGEAVMLEGRTPVLLGESQQSNDILYNLAKARVEKGMCASAIKLCQDALEQSYAKAEAIIFDCDETEGETLSSLLELQADLVAAWCAYTRVLIDVVTVIAREPQNSWKRIGKQRVLNFMDSLLNFGFSSLEKAISCPLVGSHGVITLALARLSHYLHGASPAGSASSNDKGIYRVESLLVDCECLRYLQVVELPSSLRQSCGFGSEVTLPPLEPAHCRIVAAELERLKCADNGQKVGAIHFIDQLENAAAGLANLPTLPRSQSSDLEHLSTSHVESTEEKDAMRNDALILDQYTALISSESKRHDEDSGSVGTTARKRSTKLDRGPGSACFGIIQVGVSVSELMTELPVRDSLFKMGQTRINAGVNVLKEPFTRQRIERRKRPRRDNVGSDIRFPCKRCKTADFESSAQLKCHLESCCISDTVTTTPEDAGGWSLPDMGATNIIDLVRMR